MSLDDKIEKVMRFGFLGMKRALFMTPMMAGAELIAGLENSQTLKTRLLSLGVNFAVAMPYQEWFKPKVYALLGVTETSPDYQKNLANKAAFAAHQIPLYTTMLAAAGASLEQIVIALPTGVAVGIATAGRFQEFMDKAEEFVLTKAYKAKDSAKQLSILIHSYAKNFAYATMIAGAIKAGVHYPPHYFPLVQPQDVLVYDNAAPDATYFINPQDFDKTRHLAVFPVEQKLQ